MSLQFISTIRHIHQKEDRPEEELDYIYAVQPLTYGICVT